MNNKVYTVTELNENIKSLLKNNFCYPIQLNGEISNFKPKNDNNFGIFFNVKDNFSSITVIMNPEIKAKLNFEPKNGDQVLITGNIGYGKKGYCWLIVKQMTLSGKGKYLLALDELKKKLQKEGFFARHFNPRPINKYPKLIGLITAKDSAAYHDFIKHIHERYPLTKFLIFSSLVQGEKAPEELINNLKKAYSYNLDTIIIGRGGGSTEDLDAFNDENLAKTAFESKCPIISAVGHEIDQTILDCVADYRASTPTGAANIAVYDKEEIKRNLKEKKDKIKEIISYKIHFFKEKIKSFKKHPFFSDSHYFYQKEFNKIKIYKLELNNVIKNYFYDKKNELKLKKDKLDNINPKKILQRGFSLLKNKDGKIIKKINDVEINEKIEAILYNGNLGMNIISKKDNNSYE